MASLASRLTNKRTNAFKKAKKVEYDPNFLEQLAKEKAKRKKLKEELGLSSGDDDDNINSTSQYYCNIYIALCRACNNNIIYNIYTRVQ